MARRELLRPLGVSLFGALGVLAGGQAGGVAGFAWLALVAPCCGALAAPRSGDVAPRSGSRRLALVPPTLWLLLALALPHAALPAAPAAWLVVGLLYAIGWACGGRTGVPALLLLTSLSLCALPTWGGLGTSPWPAALGARFLDLSPTALVLESGGLDWMRHPAIYDPVGSSSIGPELRAPWRAPLASAVLVVVGCLAFAVGRLLRPEH